MDVSFSPAEEKFRDEVRGFIAEKYPPHLRGKSRSEFRSREDFLTWHRALHKRGWVAPSWPKQYGGTGWTSTQKYIFSEECAKADTPLVLPFGVAMVGPVIYTFADEEQKKEHLPKILSGDVWWCQGYSEPGAGSDLASVKTRAVRDGDHYVINGQKTWTTLAQYANWIFVLARTNPEAKAQEGISFILVDMASPGVTVRPIITMDGAHEVNEVFLDNVRVPVKNLIGKENEGWTYAKFLLSHERAGIAGVARSKRGVERLKALALAEKESEKPLLNDPEFARSVAELEIDLLALEYTELRTLAGEAAGKGPGLESSILKIKGTDIQQRLTELTLDAVAYYGMPYRPHGHELETLTNEYVPGPDYAHGVSQNYFLTRRVSIYGGSNEIQRNIIAKMVLGL
jgi:alkylation response protein AidB-like acyl-CoA dehydrogenase